MTMIGLKCWGCGWEGRVPDSYAGQQVTCKRCRSVSAVPDRITEEIYVAHWFAAAEVASGAVTLEVHIPERIRAAV